MELIPGTTLEECWETLTRQERASIADQLAYFIRHLRTPRLDPEEQFIGSISGGRVQELYLRGDEGAGPFPTLKEFNDRLQRWTCHGMPSPKGPDLVRADLPDNVEICFTHADLHLDNIMVDGIPGSRRIVGIIDWGQAGWYPVYWEYCKMVIGTHHLEWYSQGWIHRVLAPYPGESRAFGYYWNCNPP